MGYRNNCYFPHTNPYKYANHSSHVAMQRSTYKELLIYRAWATCDLGTKFLRISHIGKIAVR